MGLSELPDASGLQHQRTFESFGWITRRAAEHIIMTHPNTFGVTLAIPNHRSVKRATLHKLVRSAGLTDAEYRQQFNTL